MLGVEMAAGAPAAPKMEAMGGGNDQSAAGGLNNKAATLDDGDDPSAWVSGSHDNLCFQRARSVSRRCHPARTARTRHVCGREATARDGQVRLTVGAYRRVAVNFTSIPPLLTESAAHCRPCAVCLSDGRITGAQVHDARVAALCRQHGVRELWSADRDFSRFNGLAVVNPLIHAS